ncbi:MAG: thioredoxin family protein [Chloroflexota bacterium]|nr:thioredoxin family protein [Chloroflexota bacterium]
MKKIFLITILIIIFGCSNETAKNETQNLLSLFIITEDLEIGNNRVVLSVLDEKGQTITENLKFSFKKLESNKITKIEEINTSFWPPKRNVFVTKINFEEPGYWEFIVNRDQETAKATVNVLENSSTLSVGDTVEPIYTPSINDFEISKISTDIKADRNLYKYSLENALKLKKPILLSFSTPGLCVTGACAPQLEELKKISSSDNDVIIIHVEIWKNFDEIMKKGDLSVGILNDAVQKFNIKTEPWTFLINSNGKVNNRYQGFVESKEIKLELSKLY